ncbi:hypothetical protein [cf. Phormidesmis sp. LEGE 11477]|uniref:hypothetical protein n=1 Tax=cf. Phormidesmis sp. LEGE 11477 TaxID=1828680 RepID=UPI00187EFFC9|nr:hypothetical protein [cf. Phormidesmis sp. LEGE 11477]MBE9062836.1 hypothetical protein [cf. Phormidesmis sp. LEGE 11477]
MSDSEPFHSDPDTPESKPPIYIEEDSSSLPNDESLNHQIPSHLTINGEAVRLKVAIATTARSYQQQMVEQNCRHQKQVEVYNRQIEDLKIQLATLKISNCVLERSNHTRTQSHSSKNLSQEQSHTGSIAVSLSHISPTYIPLKSRPKPSNQPKNALQGSLLYVTGSMIFVLSTSIVFDLTVSVVAARIIFLVARIIFEAIIVSIVVVSIEKSIRP